MKVNTLWKTAAHKSMVLLMLMVVCMICGKTAHAAEVISNVQPLQLTELKLSHRVLTDAGPLRVNAVVESDGAELPKHIDIILRDIADPNAVGESLTITLYLQNDDVRLPARYSGEHSFPEEVKHTRALSAVSWQYSPVGTRTVFPITQSLEHIAKAYVFIPKKPAAEGYVAPPIAVAYQPVYNYILRKAEQLQRLDAIDVSCDETNVVTIAMHGYQMPAEDLLLTWTNGSDSRTVNLPRTEAQLWEGTFTWAQPTPGRYRLTQIALADGTRLRNYPDSYVTLQALSTNAPRVTVTSNSVSLVNRKLRGTVHLGGDTEGISRVTMYWTQTNPAGDPVGSAVTTADQISALIWTCDFVPSIANTYNDWTITSIRVWYYAGWQILLEDPALFGDPSGVTYGGSDVIDLPVYQDGENIAAGRLLTFVFPKDKEMWQAGDVRLTYTSRNEAWVLDPAERKLIVYHPYSEQGIYNIRVHPAAGGEEIALYR